MFWSTYLKVDCTIRISKSLKALKFRELSYLWCLEFVLREDDLETRVIELREIESWRGLS